MRRALLAAALALFFVVAPIPARAASCPGYGTCVKISDSAFTPGSVRIPVNGDIFWCPDDANQLTHKIHADDGSFISIDIPPGSGCTGHTFQQAGSFPYHCEHHPSMRGTINVGDAQAQVTTTAAPRPATTTATNAPRVTTTVGKATATTARSRAVATTTEPDEMTTSTTEPVEDDATTTTEGQVAIKQTSNDTGPGKGSIAAVIAALGMLIGGGGYLVIRRRQMRFR
jgi:LPXTG-motif cell wall-anchored protein